MILWWWLACDPTSDAPWCSDAPSTPIVPEQTPTWLGDIRPVVDQKCAACHGPDGHVPFPLDDPDAMAGYAPAMAAAVTDGRMPPFLAAGCCAPLLGDFSLTPAEVGALVAWADAGAPPGDVAAPLRAPLVGLSRVDVRVGMAEPYVPAPPGGSGDDTRCFVLDWPLETTAFVTGLQPSPGDRRLVHHLILAAIPPGSVGAIERLDTAAGGYGFPCPGGAGALPTVQPIGGSLMGGDLPRGIGTRVEAGSKLLLQVHYYVDPGTTGADQTTLDLRVASEAVETGTIVLSNPGWLVGRGMLVPAGEADVGYAVSSRPDLFTGGVTVDLQGVTPHLHRYGSRVRVLRLRADGTEDCLLEIPAWRFRWEMPYWLAEPVRLEPGERLYLECRFDNSSENQPDGGAPEDLAWGEDDQDMCAAFVVFTKP